MEATKDTIPINKLVDRLLILAEWQDKTEIEPNFGNEPYYDGELPAVSIETIKQEYAGLGARGVRLVCGMLLTSMSTTCEDARAQLRSMAGAILAKAEIESEKADSN